MLPKLRSRIPYAGRRFAERDGTIQHFCIPQNRVIEINNIIIRQDLRIFNHVGNILDPLIDDIPFLIEGFFDILTVFSDKDFVQ